nr:unnamed protein product [Digitaria exilis]
MSTLHNGIQAQVVSLEFAKANTRLVLPFPYISQRLLIWQVPAPAAKGSKPDLTSNPVLEMAGELNHRAVPIRRTGYPSRRRPCILFRPVPHRHPHGRRPVGRQVMNGNKRFYESPLKKYPPTSRPHRPSGPLDWVAPDRTVAVNRFFLPRSSPYSRRPMRTPSPPPPQSSQGRAGKVGPGVQPPKLGQPVAALATTASAQLGSWIVPGADFAAGRGDGESASKLLASFPDEPEHGKQLISPEEEEERGGGKSWVDHVLQPALPCLPGSIFSGPRTISWPANHDAMINESGTIETAAVLEDVAS